MTTHQPWPTRMTITLCGSTRFKPHFEAAARQLTLAGVIVLAPGVFAHAEGVTLAPGQKAGLDALHLAKIDRSDAVLVINPGGYIGDSTRAEIAHARRRGIPVAYSSTLIGWTAHCHSDGTPFGRCPAPLLADVASLAEAEQLAGEHNDRHHAGESLAIVEPMWDDATGDPFAPFPFTDAA